MAPKLYMVEMSPPVRSVLITAAAIGLELEKQYIDPTRGDHLTPEFLKLNPQHTVPTLVDGDFVLWDSHAINPYLVSKYAKDDSLYPKDIQKRAIVDNRLHYNNATIFNSLKSVGKLIFQGADSVTEKANNNATVFNTMKTVVRPIVQGTGTLTEEHIKSFEEFYSLLNTFLERTKFIAGDSLTIADFSVISTVSGAEVVVPVDEVKFPKLVQWEKKMEELPCYAVSKPGIKMLEEILLPKLKK